MATGDPTEHSQLDVISEEIKEVFERILSEARARRDELLEQVIRMKIEFETKKLPLFESLKEFEEMRIHLDKLSLKQNLTTKKQRESLADIDSEIGKIRFALSAESSLKFNCSTNQLIEQVRQFGEFIDLSSSLIESHSKYSKKLTAANFILGVIPDVSPLRLHVDHENNLLYIFSTNANSKKIGVYDAITFSYVKEISIGSGIRCIATNKDYVYLGMFRLSISDFPSYLSIYSKGSFLRSVNFQNETSNIFVESENKVFVLCVAKNKLSFHIYNKALYLQGEREFVYQWPDSLSEIRSQFKDEKLYILHDKQFLVFNSFGKNTHSIKMGGTAMSSILYVIFVIYFVLFCCLVRPTKWNPTSFCLDEIGNIIVTNSATNSIKFFSPEGDLFHTIGEDTVGSDEVVGATDIVMYRDILIVVYGNHIRTY